MAYESGSVTAQHVSDHFNAAVIDRVKSLIVWWSGNNPSGNVTPPGTPYQWYYNYAVIYKTVQITNRLSSSNNPVNDLGGPNYPPGAIKWSQVQSNLQWAASCLTTVRRTRLIKYYNYGGGLNYWNDGPWAGSDSVYYDQTQWANLNANYQAPTTSMDAAAPTTMSAADFDTYVQALSDQVDSYINQVVTFEERYCHTSCHANHNSRNRR